MRKHIIVFHHDDHDGFCSAWAAWKKFKNRAVYIALDHPIVFAKIRPYVSENSTVYFLDLCPDESVLERMKRIADRIIIIDHHASREKTIRAQPGSVFDDTHSAAFLAWKYFHPQTKIPRIIGYIQDFDIWQWKLRGTEALLVALPWKFTFASWEKLARIVENIKTRSAYIRSGLIMLQYKQQLIDLIVQDAEEARFGRIPAFVVNTPIIHSEVGHALAKKKKGVHVGILMRMIEKGTLFYISLRSDGTVDVSKIAQKYGGGGHKAAAAFRWPITKPLPFKFVKTKRKS